MKTLIFGAGPIGRWLALKLKKADKDVTLLARGTSYENLEHHGVRFIDAPTGEHLSARVQLVKEQNDLALGLLDLAQYRLEPFFELAAILRAGNQRAQIEGNHPLVLQTLGHVALNDA